MNTRSLAAETTEVLKAALISPTYSYRSSEIPELELS